MSKKKKPQKIDQSGKPVNEEVCESLGLDDLSIPKELQAEIENLKKIARERDEFRDSLQRLQADFDNYQKRVKRDKACWEQYKDEDLLKGLLPAFDNLDRTTQIKCESEDAVCLKEGVDLIKREIRRVLEQQGVSGIKTLGEQFDPARHEAVEGVATDDQPAGTILEEVRSGFMLHDRVLRPAQVKVAVEPKQSSVDETKEKEA